MQILDVFSWLPQVVKKAIKDALKEFYKDSDK